MQKGFDAIRNQLEKSNDLNVCIAFNINKKTKKIKIYSLLFIICVTQEFNALLKPLAICSFLLNDSIFQLNFESSIKKIFQHIKSLSDDDYKDKVNI